MPKRFVLIEWDTPDYEGWLADDNIALALRMACPNTNFKVQSEQLMSTLFYKATEFEVMPQIFDRGRAIGEITIKRRIQTDGSTKWGIYLRDICALDSDGNWLYEPLPSSRTDEYLQNTRFEFQDAWERASKAALHETQRFQQGSGVSDEELSSAKE